MQIQLKAQLPLLNYDLQPGLKLLAGRPNWVIISDD
jgi:hypothetical protein